MRECDQGLLVKGMGKLAPEMDLCKGLPPPENPQITHQPFPGKCYPTESERSSCLHPKLHFVSISTSLEYFPLALVSLPKSSTILVPNMCWIKILNITLAGDNGS